MDETGRYPCAGACVAPMMLLVLTASALAAPTLVDDGLFHYTEARERCHHRTPTRRAFFGDLHIHTAYSYDARPAGTRTTPADAYRFARGVPLSIPPYDEQGMPSAVLKLQRPLDFAAVTDHSEYFGEIALCFDADSVSYETPACQGFREGAPDTAFALIRMMLLREDPQRMAEICGEDGAVCQEAEVSLWQLTQEMAEAAYDRSSACEFTTFVGYEHTGTPNANNVHRNVIFRNRNVPERAVSYVDTPSDRLLWESLQAECLAGIEGCDVLAIPHNANLSSGAMFPSYVGRTESPGADNALASLRNAMEPIMEVFQHKGNSECFNGLPDILGAPDELCDIEQVHLLSKTFEAGGDGVGVRFCEDGEVGTRGFLASGCISKNDFFRSVLLTGLQDEAQIGVNPYKLGVIASTDTHMSLAGATVEEEWRGHLVSEVSLADRLSLIAGGGSRSLSANPGGLAGVWAIENSRDAIFEALQKREVFGTTGTRIQPRFFAGWDFSGEACVMRERDAHGYLRGTPMGGDLLAGPMGDAPEFLAYAAQDPQAAALQKLQIIKGWIDSSGMSRYKVFDVAEEGGPGASALCAVFKDPEFNRQQPAYYYMRVVEIPTPRWSWRVCMDLPAQDRPDECANDAPRFQQELAWTSPIWYLPPAGSPAN